MADALHGLGDTAAQVVAALAHSQAAKPPDKDYPWGYGKIESVATLMISGILLWAAISIGWESATSLFTCLTEMRRGVCSEDPPKPPGATADAGATAPTSAAGEPEVAKTKRGGKDTVGTAVIAIAVASVALKEALFRATLSVGTASESRLAVATAWQHRSDSLSAIVAFGSQLGAAYGHHYLDAVGGGVVASMLAESAFSSLKDSLEDLLDHNHASGVTEGRCGREVLGESITPVPGVRNHTLRTRRMGPYCLVDVTIVVDARISASAASMVAEAVHNRVIDDFHPFVTDVVVHVDPDGNPQWHQLDPEAENSTASGARLDTLTAHGVVEEKVREAIMSLNDRKTNLPKITEITELQTYYAESAGASDPSGAFVDVKVDLRLPLEHTTLRDAQRVARAARDQVLEALPGIVRDVDVDLELDENSTEDAPIENATTLCKS
jgi:divalent metal cation (Fe/Co/Zn/Cd) transporter